SRASSTRPMPPILASTASKRSNWWPGISSDESMPWSARTRLLMATLPTSSYSWPRSGGSCLGGGSGMRAGSNRRANSSSLSPPISMSSSAVKSSTPLSRSSSGESGCDTATRAYPLSSACVCTVLGWVGVVVGTGIHGPAFCTLAAMDLDELVAAAQSGDARAWKKLVPRLTVAIRRCFGGDFDESDIGDLIQTTLLVIFRKLPEFEFQAGSPITRWAQGIARIEARNERRKRQRRRRVEGQAAELRRPTTTHLSSWMDRAAKL